MFESMPRTPLIVLILALLLITTADVRGQQNVTFVHGLNGSSSSLSYVDNTLSDEYDINTRRFTYDSDLPISTIAQDNAPFLLSNSVVVAHSMGGVVTREMVRQGNGGNVDALITAGTPHRGALIANAVRDGAAEYAISLTAADITLGWARACIVESWVPYVCSSVAEQIVQSLLRSGILANLLNDVEPYGGLRSTADLEVDSGFMAQLNQDPSDTLPNAHYAIYGTEEFWPSIRYAESLLQAGQSGNANNSEDGDAIRAWGSAAAVHLALAYRYQSKSNDAYNEYLRTGDYTYYYDYLDYQYVVEGFLIGFVSMVDWHHRRWDIVTGQIGAGVVAPFDVYVGGDALVASPSAAPNFISGTRRILANGGDGANHTELLGPNGISALRQTFDKPDVNVPDAPNDNGGSGDDPIINPTPCPSDPQLILCPQPRPLE